MPAPAGGARHAPGAPAPAGGARHARGAPDARASEPLGPAAAAVRDRLRRQIADGDPAPGDRLGAEREIAERLRVSRSTVRAALADLERTGAVRRVRGRSGGIFVAERKI